MKVIKSIRILDGRSPSVKKTPQHNEPFSFSKKGAQLFHPPDIANLERMIKAMLRKCEKQSLSIRQLNEQYSQWEAQKQRNQHLRQQLHELKELMKNLLLEREEMRVFDFYEQ